MAKKDIAEDTKTQFDMNRKAKVNKGDQPKAIKDPDEDVINKKPVVRYTDNLPDYSVATSKDKSKSSKVAHGASKGEQQKAVMDNMPGVNKLKEGQEPSTQDETILEDEELTEEEAALIVAHRESIMEELASRIAHYIPEKNESLDVSGHVEVMFEGQEDLSEDFKNKAKTIFEAAVNSEVQKVLGSILEASVDTIIEHDISLVESYDEKIENALTAIAETWMETNAVGIQSQLKTEITEDFIHGLMKLLEEHNIMLPEDKVDVVESMADEILELQDSLNEQIEVNISLKETLDEALREAIVDELAEGLDDVAASKFKTLCEGIDEGNFEEKAVQLRESYFDKSGPKPKLGKGLEETVLTEDEVNQEAKTITEETKKQSQVSAAMSRFAPRR